MLNSRQRSVVIRFVFSIILFIYIGVLAWDQLPRFDFKVIMAFFFIYLFWNAFSQTFVYKDPDSYAIDDGDRKSYLYLQLTFFIALIYGTTDFVELHYTRLTNIEPAIVYIGFGLFIISCVINWWGYKYLGKFFNPRVSIYENHELITNGAYRNIRHPLYLSSLINFIAIPAIFSSWGALIIVVIATIPALVYRINVEEEFLLEHFGDEYKEYIKRTRRLIPGIW